MQVSDSILLAHFLRLEPYDGDSLPSGLVDDPLTHELERLGYVRVLTPGGADRRDGHVFEIVGRFPGSGDRRG